VSVYQPAAYEAIYWPVRNSLVASERIDEKLRALRLPLAARQFIEFGLGVKSRYLGLGDAHFVRVHRIARVLSITLLATLAVAWLISLAVATYAATIGLGRRWRSAPQRTRSPPDAVGVAQAVAEESQSSLSGRRSTP